MLNNLLSQYKYTEEIKINLSSTIDSLYIRNFVQGYKELLIEKQKKVKDGDFSFLEEVRVLRFIIESQDYDEDNGFDLLFISYLTLLKNDFPNITIHFEFPLFSDSSSLNVLFFQLAHHRAHLLINSKIEVFKIFRNGIEFFYNKAVQASTYIPPLVINKITLKELFSRKNDSNNFLVKNTALINSLKDDEEINKQTRDLTYKKLTDSYSESMGGISKWELSDLSNLYFFRVLYDLYVLRHFLNEINGKKSKYQIGNVIIESAEDRSSAKQFRDGVMTTLKTNGVFNFSCVEVYFFALIVQNSELFKMPTTLKKMFALIKDVLNDKEVKGLVNFDKNKLHERNLKKRFIEVYCENLVRIINYTKGFVYGLEELAKNIVEHSGEDGNGFGVITGRIYNFNKIEQLKKGIPQEWLRKYNVSKHKFIDINVVDSGLKDVINVYSQTLKSERNEIQLKINSSNRNLLDKLIKEYDDDIKLLMNFKCNNLFNYDFSLKLLHQVNRTKARLGLLIFSQTILHDKEAFVSVASNYIFDNDSIGYHIYRKENKIVDIVNKDFIPLGTNYNFIVPVNEKFITEKKEIFIDNNYQASISSVYKELLDYDTEDEKTHAKYTIVKLNSYHEFSGHDKYTKLEVIKSDIDKLSSSNTLILIDAKKLNRIIENSSDWVRLLANLQFGNDNIKDIILYNFDIELYEEIIDILKIFNNLNDNSKGFWKNDCYVLFYLPVVDYHNNVFWFNSLLCSKEYDHFLKLNEEIGLYHHNISKMISETSEKGSSIDFNKIQSKLFSSSKKLLNFELLIRNDEGVTLFEETLKSMLNVEIKSLENEN